MITNRSVWMARWGGAAALSVAALACLSACEERPYPAPTHGAPPAAKPTADLMGAPTHPSPYTAPPVVQGPPPAAYAPPPAYAPAPQYYAGGTVVAMAPIPNPGEGGSTYYDGGRHHRVHARYEAAASPSPAPVVSPYGEGHPAPGHHPTYAYVAPTLAPKAPPAYVPPVYAKAPAPKPVYAPKTPVYAPKPPVYAKAPPKPTPPVYAPKPVPPKPTYVAKVEHKSAVVAAAAGVAAGHAAVEAKQAVKAGAADIKLAAKNAVATYKAAPAPATPAPTPVPGDRTAHLASLQTALTDAIGKTAILTAPARFTANQPADVSLTIPAAFADTLRAEAQKDGLSDAAASVNMTAILSGDGFAVTPDDTQSAPLTVGQPTEMHWTVTAQPGAKGPLHADIGADLLGGGSDKLSLGSVQKAAGMGVKLTPKVIGATLLVLIAALVVAWLARGRGPTRPAAARRASRRAARGGRPLDMSSDPAPATEEPAH
jgi:hypothetical protein